MTTKLYALRYRPGTDLAARFPTTTLNTFPSREHAEAIRDRCPNAAHIEVVPVEVDDAA